jgi:hypothetical protein
MGAIKDKKALWSELRDVMPRPMQLNCGEMDSIAERTYARPLTSSKHRSGRIAVF